jgi:dynein heavy chain, axonemal
LERTFYKELKDCKAELISLKKMWDLISLIDLQFDSWKKTLWEQIDTDILQTVIKDMQGKQCNPTQPQNKDIKNYPAFTALNERVKNMNIILPLIASLHSPYMLTRHWKRLEKICGKTIAFNSPKFCLADLIQLELFRF